MSDTQAVAAPKPALIPFPATVGELAYLSRLIQREPVGEIDQGVWQLLQRMLHHIQKAAPPEPTAPAKDAAAPPSPVKATTPPAAKKASPKRRQGKKKR